MINLNNKIAIVTGAKQGMGKAHALILAQAGAKVVVSDINLLDCEKVVKEIKDLGGEALAIKCDISNKQEVDKMVQKTKEEWGRVDILVNNAGIAEFKPFLEMTEKDWDKTININLKGYFLCSLAVSKVMIEQKSGTIINIGSIAMGQMGVGFPNLVHYVSSKGGIAGMTVALAIDLAPYNIRVNAIAPGVIDTPMIDPVKSDQTGLEALIQRIPLKRTGRPEEVSNVVLFLSSDLSSYMTGTVIPVDGGWIIT
ncbi:MAG: SDR family NAD(P)-dependent oxidoreductase [Candidatus Pacebacteria bacterium]|nr:SDR family NAD(P)-dependent oxidoreductase [Candidatus Paceibacterota bacterium]